MKLKRHGILAGVVLTATLALAACGTDDNTTPGSDSTSPAAAGDCATGKLTAQGSTAQKNAMDQWIKDYAAKCSGASIDYQGTGSGAGIQAFTAGTADFAGSDSTLKDEEKPKANARCGPGNAAIHLPLVIGPVAVVYHVDGVTNLQLSPATLAKIFSYQVSTWNDPAIAADNPGASLPDTAILAIHRADSSGTTDNFTKYLSKTAAADWTYGNAKEWPLKKGGQGETKSDGVASAVKANQGSIGYVEWSFAEVNGLAKAKVKNGAGEYAELTAESAATTIESAKVTGTDDDLKLDIDYNTTASGAYPIVLVTYEIVCGKGTPADKLALVKGFLAYAAGDGQTALTKLGYAPLPDTVATKVKTAVANLA